MGTKLTTARKINWIWDAIDKQGLAGLAYDEKKLIAELILLHSTTRRTALELIKVFEDAGKIIRKDGKIYSKKFFSDELKLNEELFEEKKELTKEEKEILNA